MTDQEMQDNARALAETVLTALAPIVNGQKQIVVRHEPYLAGCPDSVGYRTTIHVEDKAG